MGESRINNFRKFINSSKNLFWFYVFVNMVPSISLVFTEPLNIWGKLVLISFPLGLYILILSLSKKTGITQLLLIPLLVIHAFQLVVFHLFGEDVIASDMFLNVATTNPSEAGEVLNSIWSAVLFVCILYIPAIVLAIVQTRKKLFLEKHFRRKALLSSTAIILLSVVLSFFSKNVNTQRFIFYKDIYPVDVFYNLNFAIKKWNKVRNYPITSESFSFHARKDTTISQREIYILVIGETSRADNWSLYGYDRKTNPKLEQNENIICFSDAITQSNTTHKSVSIMLSSASAENYEVIYKQKSIIDAFEEVGFTTVFLSNQGDNHMFTQFFANHADYYENIRSVGENISNTENNYDEILLPILKSYIDSIPNDLFIVLHTYGSHFNYRERYPNEFSIFKPDDVKKISKKEKSTLLNAYDNTILYTDYFLSRLIEILDKEDICSSLLYTSDHGEDILDDSRMRFLHASPNPTYYQIKVPFLLWFSDNYKKNFPAKVQAAKHNQNKPVASNAVFHTLLDIGAINTEYLDSDLSILNSGFKIKKRMYLDDHDQPLFYYDTNLKEEDRYMINKRKMHH